MNDDARRYSPATIRNRDAILTVLKRYLPKSGLVLEVASGSGEHITHFAKASSAELVFQPSDPDASARASIDAWVGDLGLDNVRPALELDATSSVWPVTRAHAVLCINMIHIAPWAATVGLMARASKVLRNGGFLYLYGPYQRDDQHTASSNAAFDQDLRARNPAWGVRNLETVAALAEEHGFAKPIVEEMPANNLSLIFRRTAT